MNFKNSKIIIAIAVIFFIGILSFNFISSNMHSSDVLINVPKSIPVDYSKDKTHDSNANPFYQTSYTYYDNYEMADKRVNLIFIGDVVKVHDAKELVIARDTYPNTGETIERKLVHTLSDVRVDKVIKGNIKKGDIIQVAQLGGIINSVPRLASDVEYFKKDEHRIFFLESFEDKDFGFKTYPSPINPGQGSILIEDGKIKRTDVMQFINDGIQEDIVVDALKEKVKKLQKN